jgi:prolyl-tRNA synthetase
MKYTELLLKTSRENPSNEEAKNAQILIRAGMIKKELAGVYSFLPLGLKVLRKVENIIRKHMDNNGFNELLMPSIAPQENWQKTGRWNSVDVLYKLEMSNGKEVALSPTHEEVITPLVKDCCQSPKDFPSKVYQIQTKFRNEPRAKSGLLRGREFLMKDAYSFHLTEECFEKLYEKVKEIYVDIYKELGIGEQTKIVKADGGDFSEFSYEFQTISEIGEDEIFLNPENNEYYNKEIVSAENQQKWKSFKAVEVGNIFPLSDKFSKSFDYKIAGKNIIMGCYGIGVSRIMGILAELNIDEKGLVWDEKIAPVEFYLAGIGKDEKTWEKAEEIYEILKKAGKEVLFDDRKDKKSGFGVKISDAELLGIPTCIICSDKLIEDNDLEIRYRKSGESEKVKIDDWIKKILN